MTHSTPTESYAVTNTKNVITALHAYNQSVPTLRTTPARAVAISSYEKATGKRVCDRTIRQWLDVAKRYGGLERIPADAFGALKSRPHAVHSRFERVRAIQAQCDNIAAIVRLARRDDIIDLGELAEIDRALRERLRYARGNKTSDLLASIEETARQFETVRPKPRRNRITGTEQKTTLRDLVERLEKLTDPTPSLARSARAFGARATEREEK